MEGIKETKELLNGVAEAIKAGKKIRDIVSDGVNIADAPKALELIKEQSGKIEIYASAAKDAGKVKAELQDLEKSEIIELIMEIVEAVSEIEKV